MRRIDGVRHVVAPSPPTTEFLTERREAVRRRVDHLHNPIIRHEHERYQHDARDHQNHDRVLFVPPDDPVNNRLSQERREEPARREGEGVILGHEACVERTPSRDA